jgi:hypothetical protein
VGVLRKWLKVLTKIPDCMEPSFDLVFKMLIPILAFEPIYSIASSTRSVLTMVGVLEELIHVVPSLVGNAIIEVRKWSK